MRNTVTAAISVRQPETDLVPGGSGSGFGHLRSHEGTHPNRLIGVQFLVRCTKLKHLFIS